MVFNQIVLTIAAVLLILTLIVLAILLYNSHGALQYPPEIGQCPDYWMLNDQNGKAQCQNTKDLGTCGSGGVDPSQWAKGKSGNKQRCEWAKGCGLTWDGITNANYC